MDGLKIGFDDIKFTITPKAIWITLEILCKFIFGTIKEMWYDVKFYKYELYVHSERDEKEGLGESRRRMKIANNTRSRHDNSTVYPKV